MVLSGLRLGFRVRRSRIGTLHLCDGRGDAETEASETNRREVYGSCCLPCFDDKYEALSLMIELTGEPVQVAARQAG